MNINDYSMKVKKMVDSLAPIGVLVEDDDLVCIIWNGLGKEYRQFWSFIKLHATFLDFWELIALLIIEE